MNDLLPIGSIIKTNSPRNLMIVGYYPSKIESDDFYDYICCKTRLGLIVNNKDLKKDQDYFYVNNEDIKKVLFIGLQTSNFEKYKEMLIKGKEKFLEAKKNNLLKTDDDVNQFYKKFFEEYKKQ